MNGEAILPAGIATPVASAPAVGVERPLEGWDPAIPEPDTVEGWLKQGQVCNKECESLAKRAGLWYWEAGQCVARAHRLHRKLVPGGSGWQVMVRDNFGPESSARQCERIYEAMPWADAVDKTVTELKVKAGIIKSIILDPVEIDFEPSWLQQIKDQARPAALRKKRKADAKEAAEDEGEEDDEDIDDGDIDDGEEDDEEVEDINGDGKDGVAEALEAIVSNLQLMASNLPILLPKKDALLLLMDKVQVALDMLRKGLEKEDAQPVP